MHASAEPRQRMMSGRAAVSVTRLTNDCEAGPGTVATVSVSERAERAESADRHIGRKKAGSYPAAS